MIRIMGRNEKETFKDLNKNATFLLYFTQTLQWLAATKCFNLDISIWMAQDYRQTSLYPPLSPKLNSYQSQKSTNRFLGEKLFIYL